MDDLVPEKSTIFEVRDASPESNDKNGLHNAAQAYYSARGGPQISEQTRVRVCKDIVLIEFKLTL